MNLIKVSNETRVADLLKVAFPDRTLDAWDGLDGVRFRSISARYSSEWHYSFGGVQLSVHRMHRNEIRKVLVKDGQIDLDQIRAKHAELVPIALEYRKQQQASNEREKQREDRLKSFRTNHCIDEYSSMVSIDNQGKFTLRFPELTEEQAKAMMAAYRGKTGG